jgi:hypothetical protein
MNVQPGHTINNQYHRLKVEKGTNYPASGAISQSALPRCSTNTVVSASNRNNHA